MIETSVESPINHSRTLIGEILDDSNGWLRDVLRRFLLEGRLDAGSISCHKSLQQLLRLGLVMQLKDDPDDMDYQITDKGADHTYVLDGNSTFKKGDWVTLCPVEFDCNSYDPVLRVQGFTEQGNVLVAYPDDFKWDNNPPYKVLDIDVQLAELNHATYEECQQGQRR